MEASHPSLPDRCGVAGLWPRGPGRAARGRRGSCGRPSGRANCLSIEWACAARPTAGPAASAATAARSSPRLHGSRASARRGGETTPPCSAARGRAPPAPSAGSTQAAARSLPASPNARVSRRPGCDSAASSWRRRVPYRLLQQLGDARHLRPLYPSWQQQRSAAETRPEPYTAGGGVDIAEESTQRRSRPSWIGMRV